MTGHDVLMISGTDEHGTPILVQAEDATSTRTGQSAHDQPDGAAENANHDC
jgi:methionyl-tRNA synthetase